MDNHTLHINFIITQLLNNLAHPIGQQTPTQSNPILAINQNNALPLHFFGGNPNSQTMGQASAFHQAINSFNPQVQGGGKDQFSSVNLGQTWNNPNLVNTQFMSSLPGAGQQVQAPGIMNTDLLNLPGTSEGGVMGAMKGY